MVFPGLPQGSVAVSAGYALDLQPRMCLGSQRSLTDSENGPLITPTDWGGAKEVTGVIRVKKSRSGRPLESILTIVIVAKPCPKHQCGQPPDSVESKIPASPMGSVTVTAASGYLLALLVTICRGSLSLTDSENGPLMAPTDWGAVKGAEKVKKSQPPASIPLAIATPLMTPGHLVGVGGCPYTRAVPPNIPPSAIMYLSSAGLAAVRGPSWAHSVTVTPPRPMSPSASATRLSCLVHLHRGALQVSLVLPQEPRAQSR